MPKKPRSFEDGAYYHVIARGNNHAPVFAIEGGYRSFRKLILSSKQRLEYKLHHYCLMPNHLHMLLRPDRSAELPKIMHMLLLGYTRWYKTQLPFTGQLWQGRYKCLPITDESYLFECGRYIERNPVRAHLVSRPEDYTWSSYKHYAVGSTDNLISDNPYYESFGSNPHTRQKNYREFVQIDLGSMRI